MKQSAVSREETYASFMCGEIDQFYATVYPSLLVFARRLLSPALAYLAEDCVQDAVFKLYQRRGDLKSYPQARAFLYTCLHNAVVTYLRKDSSQSHYLAQREAAMEDDISVELIRQETLDQLFSAIDRLPDDMQQLCHMIFRDGMKNAEIARALHLTESGVKKRKARLLAMLRATLSTDAYLLAVWVIGQ